MTDAAMVPVCENACSDRKQCYNVQAWFACNHTQCVSTTAQIERCIRCGCSRKSWFPITIKIPTGKSIFGKTIFVNAYKWWTIEVLLNRIQDFDFDFDVEFEGTLVFESQMLENDKTLSDYNIQKDSIVELIVKPAPAMAKEDNRTAIALKVSTSDSDAALEDMFRQTMRAIKEMKGSTDSIHVTFYTDEFDSDPRELYQIDSAKQLFKRIVGLGAYGLMLYPKTFNMSTIADKMHEDTVLENFFWFPLCIAYSPNGRIDIREMTPRIGISCDLFKRKFDPEKTKESKKTDLGAMD